MNLGERSAEAEWMDGDVAPEAFAAVMADLARVNTVTLARRPTLAFVRRALARAEHPLTIVDVGFGDGDMLRGLARRFGARVRLVGYDINPRSLPAAVARTPAALGIDYRTGDAFAHRGPIDLVVSSLVAHHMEDGEIVAFLRWMDGRAARGWFVNDLHRHALALHGFRLMGTLARWHPMVRHDGALSVARSFRRADWERLIAAAGLPRAEVRLRWHLPFRWCVGRLR